MNYYTFNELANNIGCNTYREPTSGKITVHRKGRTIGTIYKEDGGDIKIVFTKNKLSAANKLTATDREKIMEHKLGDTFAVVECDD